MTSTDSEEEDLDAAIAMSLATHESHGPSASPTSMSRADLDPDTCVPSIKSSSVLAGLAGLDRQAMEKERLARLAARERSSQKRERSISPPSVRNTRKAPTLEETTVELPSGARLNMFSTIVSQDQSGRKTDIANAANAQLKTKRKGVVSDRDTRHPADADTSLKYPHGVVKKTWAFGHERDGNDVKLEEVLEPRSLRTAVLSAFQWDIDWVLSKLNIPPKGGITKCIFVMQAKQDELRQQMIEQTEGMRSFLRLCFPSMVGQINCMHSKLMLLFHPHKLRVAVPSANLLNFDWGETGVMENSVFLVDLPRLPEGVKAKAEELTPFGQELMYFLKKQGLDDDVQNGVLGFDFSATNDIAFVHTVGGSSYREEAGRTGFPGLSRAVRQLGLLTDDVEIDFAASSIGSLHDEYLRNVHSAARGNDMIVQSTTMASKAKADFFKAPTGGERRTNVNIRDKVRIYFPTHSTVRASTAGAAGTICISRQYWENMPFPRPCFRDYRSVRPGLLSHNKIMYARGKRRDASTGSAKDVAWVYHGSANMSESAWGKLVYDKKEKAWKINCRNWECGVLLRVPPQELASVQQQPATETNKRAKIDGEDSETEGEGEGQAVNRNEAGLVGMEIFDGLVKPPFEFPGSKYDGRQPWYFKEQSD